MSLDRADSSTIRSKDRSAILSAFGITNTEVFARGTEAEVYEHDETTLLKLYAGTERIAYLETLRELYISIETPTSLMLPRILDLRTIGQTVAVVETRLLGQPLESHLPHLSGAALERAEDLYFDAVCQMRHIRFKTPPARYLLFDKTRNSEVSQQSFGAFYAGLLAAKVAQVGPFLEEALNGFNEKAAALIQAIRQQPQTPLALIHGDFFPGNLLVNDDVTQVTGVIDFGSFTMFGNSVLDVAGAFGYYKMYDPERRAIRAALSPRVLSRLALDEHKQFYQFLLANAILTSNLYASDPDPRADGHFQWAAEIVSTSEYWTQALS